MDHPSSSESIIYMSPHNPKFAIKQAHPASLLEDQAVPPHFQNEFDQYHSVIQTPEKPNRKCVKQELNKSSNSKPLEHFPDPYAHFQNDMIAPNILSKEKEEVQQVICIPRDKTVKKAIKYEEILINKLLASPKKQPKPPKIPKSNQILTFQDEYEEILYKISQNEPFTISKVYFFNTDLDLNEGLSKLICFDLNPKNGRYVKFDHKSKTCIPLFKCYGCRKSFSVAAALGGHLSKCQRKQDHFEKSENVIEFGDSEDEEGHAKFLGEVKIEESDSSEAKEEKRKVKKQAKRTIRQENYTRTHRAKEADRLDRSSPIRLAKLKAGLLIRETIHSYL